MFAADLHGEGWYRAAIAELDQGSLTASSLVDLVPASR
jgi:hypothetical protein